MKWFSWYRPSKQNCNHTINITLENRNNTFINNSIYSNLHCLSPKKTYLLFKSLKHFYRVCKEKKIFFSREKNKKLQYTNLLVYLIYLNKVKYKVIHRFSHLLAINGVITKNTEAMSEAVEKTAGTDHQIYSVYNI